jgi:ribosomal protein L37E
MPGFSEEYKKAIIKTLIEKKAELPCPRCGHNHFSLIDGYLNQPVSENIKGIVLGGKTVPAIGVVCANCGFISLHAAGVLGLMSTDSDTPAANASEKEESHETKTSS